MSPKLIWWTWADVFSSLSASFILSMNCIWLHELIKHFFYYIYHLFVLVWSTYYGKTTYINYKEKFYFIYSLLLYLEKERYISLVFFSTLFHNNKTFTKKYLDIYNFLSFNFKSNILNANVYISLPVSIIENSLLFKLFKIVHFHTEDSKVTLLSNLIMYDKYILPIH